MSQAPQIGKPPERQRPPSTFQGGMRRIVYVEQPQEKPQPKEEAMPEGLTRGKALAWLSRYGYLSDLPKGATITKLEPSEQGYNIEYSTPSHEAMFTYKGERISGKELARIAGQAPAGYEISSIKREGDVLNIVYQQPQEAAPKSQPFYGLIGVEHGGLIQAAVEAPTVSEIMALAGRTEAVAIPFTEQEAFQIIAVASLTYGLTKAVASIPAVRMHLPTSVRNALAPKVQVWQDIGMEQAYSAMDIEAPSETMSYRVEQYARSTFIGKGTPITPMSRTLELARGGIIQEAEQILIQEPLIQPNLRTYLPYPQTFATIPEARTPFLITPFLFQPTRLTQPSTPQQLTRTIASTQTITSLRQSLFSETMLQQSQQQQTRQMQKQLQMQSQMQIQMQRQQQTFLDGLLPKVKRKGKQEPFGLWGRYKRFYPVATAQQVMRIRKKDMFW